MEKVTSETILQYIKNAIETKTPLDSEVWLDAASKLNIFLGDELDKLSVMKNNVAKKRLEILNKMEKRNVSEAKISIEASDEYLEMQKQENLCDVIQEFIRIAKIQSRKEGGY